MESRTALLARLTRVLASTEPRAALPQRMCMAFSQMTRSLGSAMTMGFAPSERVILGATDSRAQRIEELQDLLRQGPSLDAYRTGTVIGGFSRAEQLLRWPLLCESLDSAEENLVLTSYPMRPDSIVLGVLTVHQTHEMGVGLSPEEAQFLADAVGVAVLGQLDPQATSLVEASYGDQAWRDQDKIAAATGMVIAQLRISPEDALAVLRAHAFAHDTTLVRVSEEVVARAIVFKGDNDEVDR